MAKFPVGIEHVVVLCLENRSFDHMLGFLGTPNGLTGDELNLTDPEDPASTPVKVSNTAAYVGDLDVDPVARGDAGPGAAVRRGRHAARRTACTTSGSCSTTAGSPARRRRRTS